MNVKQKITSYAGDVRFWIILFFIVRLYGITNPPLEVAHNWRQTTVTMVARNFLHVENNILYPRVDMAGEKTGITGMEFPILNYSIYLVSEIFGYQHWYGRLINLLVSSIGLLFFSKLVSKYFNERVAFDATLILICSIWFAYSRKIMPDTFATSFIITAIYFGSNYLEGKGGRSRLGNLILSGLLLLIGVLAKLPVGYLLVVFVPLFLDRKIPFIRKFLFGIYAASLLCLPVIWYFYWTPKLVEEYGFWHFFMGVDITQGIKEIFDNIGITLKIFYADSMKYIGFIAFLIGLFFAVKKGDKKVLVIFLLTFALFLIVMFKAGFTFSHHAYYIIPYVPVMALIAGYGLQQIPSRKFALILLTLICMEGFFNQIHDFRIKEHDSALLNLERDLDTVSEPNDLIFINSGQFPTPIYFANRKGWIGFNEQIVDEKYRAQITGLGMKYIVILKRSFSSEIDLDLDLVLDNVDYKIYKHE